MFLEMAELAQDLGETSTRVVLSSAASCDGCRAPSMASASER